MIADFRRRFWVSLALTVPILVLSPTLQEWFGFSFSIPLQMPVLLVRATASTSTGDGPSCRAWSRRSPWATGYNVIAIPLAAGVLISWGIVLKPAVGAALMSLSTVIVAINARLLHEPEGPAAS